MTPQDFNDWDSFVTAVLTIPVKAQQADGLAIYYPGFSSIGLTVVVVKHYTGPEPVGKGLFHASIQLIEWSSPPNMSIVQTVAAQKADVPDTTVPQPTDPRVAAAAQARDAAYQAAFPNGGGSTF